MTDSKHTPGPWYFDPEHRPHHYGCNVGAETGECIATVAPGENGDSETIANARLIAAAPDLLAACEEFVRKVESGEARSKRSYAEMKAAISRAKGES